MRAVLGQIQFPALRYLSGMTELVVSGRVAAAVELTAGLRAFPETGLLCSDSGGGAGVALFFLGRLDLAGSDRTVLSGSERVGPGFSLRESRSHGCTSVWKVAITEGTLVYLTRGCG